MVNIMIVEDNPHNMRLFKQIILDINGQLIITEAVSGTEAIKKAEQHNYDIVLMDIALPGIDGVQTRKELKKLPNFENTVFIAVTAHALKTDQEKLMVYFDYYLSKPIDEDKLIILISDLLKQSGNMST